MQSALNACRILARSGRVLLEDVNWWLGSATARPLASSVVYVQVDSRAERDARVLGRLAAHGGLMTHPSEGHERCR